MSRATPSPPRLDTLRLIECRSDLQSLCASHTITGPAASHLLISLNILSECIDELEQQDAPCELPLSSLTGLSSAMRAVERAARGFSIPGELLIAAQALSRSAQWIKAQVIRMVLASELDTLEEYADSLRALTPSHPAHAVAGRYADEIARCLWSIESGRWQAPMQLAVLGSAVARTERAGTAGEWRAAKMALDEALRRLYDATDLSHVYSQSAARSLGRLSRERARRALSRAELVAAGHLNPFDPAAVA